MSETSLNWFESIPHLAWLMGPVGQLRRANQRWARFAGSAEKEWLQCVHPDHRERVESSIHQLFRTGLDGEITCPLQSREGVWLWHLISAVPQKSDDGRVEGWFVTGTNIHPMKQEVEESRAGETEFRLLADEIPHTVWAASPDGQMNYVNKRWTEYSGLSFEDAMGLGWTQIIHPDDQMRAWQSWSHSLQTGLPYEVEFRVRQFTGIYRWALARALPVRNDKGEIVRWMGTCTDIQVQKEATETLETFWSLPDHLLAIGDITTQRLIAVSPAWESALGLSAVELTSCPWIRFVYPDDVQATLQQFEKLTRGERVIGFENRFRCQDGRWRWLSWTVSPIQSHLYCTVQDITDLKTTQDALKIAKDDAERASRLKSAFLANMSHEIRTPLGAILGFTELLKDSTLDEDEKNSYFEVISRNGEQLTDLINDILDLSKIEAGHINIETLRTSPHVILGDVASLLNVRAKEKGIGLTTVFESSLPEVIGTDPTRLKQIVFNIVGNAVKFTQNGGVTTRVFYERSDKGQGSLVIEVSDTGIGISKEHQGRLFKAFTQADESMTRKFGGTGLGLALSKRLAEVLGGTVELVTSDPALGSIFRIQIEDRLHQIQAMKSANQSFHLSTSSSQDFAGVKVLVVEDSVDNQHLIKRILKKRNATVTVAHHGLEGVQKAEEEDFDLILMDVQMPIMDGYTATQQIRANGYTKPVIAITAHAMHEDQIRCLEVGCSDYLSKPIHAEAFVQKVAKHLQEQKIKAAVTATTLFLASQRKDVGQKEPIWALGTLQTPGSNLK